ncbi:GntR family transcriptional regulator [Kushneria sinocarnis]|uniref:GntR family transcriptional regulator n=1 Tax=Kushneria sinocarnis TaxID=595502 RepID=A0A420X0J2_9GAMM|nr:PLP-dependent aminotransferase family protein [Kushneria sinocarnis]RKR07205.1 GntR family transcriptional regulator [Kushneria sinocarnis]
MTIWIPRLSGEGPRYRQLMTAIEAAIASGELRPGDRLPPQRRLADALGVTLGTVTRAYGEVEGHGLVEARVGSGTYVRDKQGKDGLSAPFRHVAEHHDMIDLSLSLPPPHGERQAGLGRAMAAMQQDPQALGHAIDYQPEGGLESHRHCFARWMQKLGMPVSGEELIINQGGMNGIFLALAALLGPGERLAAEALSYPGLISAAQQLGVRTVALPVDDEGLDVEALARRCERQPFRALYVMPDHHNPTTVKLSEARREALVALARRHDFWLIEDGVQYLPPAQRGTPLYRLAPERTLLLFSISKILGGGLRSGVMRVPPALHGRITTAIRTQSWMPPPLIADLVCRWIDSGDADRLLQWQQQELERRHALARELLGEFDFSARPGGFYLWLPLPVGRRASALLEQLARRQVWITPAEAFCVGSEPAPQAVRICISAARDSASLELALSRLREALHHPDPAPWQTL